MTDMEYKITKISYIWNVTEKKIEDAFNNVFLRIDGDIDESLSKIENCPIPDPLYIGKHKRNMDVLTYGLFSELSLLKDQLLQAVGKNPDWEMKMSLDSIGYSKVVEYCEELFNELHIIYSYDMNSNTLEILPETQRVVYGQYF